jgi:thiol-disulfide isomerase/thioredoxin
MSLAERTVARAAYALLGAVVLGIAAGAVYRELTSPGKGVAPSRPLADLRFVDASGAPRTLRDFRGRVVLLNLWATWCTPCREEMPALDRLQAALGGPDFEVLALSLDRGGIPAVKSFYDELKLKALRIYVDPDGDALGKLGGLGIPLTVLIDREGRELWRVVGPREWDQPAQVRRIRDHLGSPATEAKDK